MSSENCTYFVSPATLPTTTGCSLQICPCGPHICQVVTIKFKKCTYIHYKYNIFPDILQLRLDFESFVITGPSTSTVTVGKALFGEISGSANAVSVTSQGQCLTDIFTVASPGNHVPPELCGDLTGEHCKLYTQNYRFELV